MRGPLLASIASAVALLCGACAIPPSPPNYEPYSEPTPEYLQMLKEQSDKEIEHLLDYPQICPDCRPLTEPIYIQRDPHHGFFVRMEGEDQIADLFFGSEKVYETIVAAQHRAMWEGVRYLCDCQGLRVSRDGQTYIKITSANIIAFPNK